MTARRWCSCTSSPATTAAGSRRFARSAAATAASPTRARLSALRRAEDPEAYSQARAVADAVAVLDALGIDRGACRRPVDGRLCDAPPRVASSGPRALARRRRVRLRRPARAAAAFREESSSSPTRSRRRARRRSPSATRSAPRACSSRTRTREDGPSSPRSSPEHSSEGSAHDDARRAARTPVALRPRRRPAPLTVPTLIVTGDEDEGCLEPSLMLKRTIPRGGLGRAAEDRPHASTSRSPSSSTGSSATSSPPWSAAPGACATRARWPRARPGWTRALRSSAAR